MRHDFLNSHCVTVCRNLTVLTTEAKWKQETLVLLNISYRNQHGFLFKMYKHDTSDKNNLWSVFILELTEKMCFFSKCAGEKNEASDHILVHSELEPMLICLCMILGCCCKKVSFKPIIGIQTEG